MENILNSSFAENIVGTRFTFYLLLVYIAALFLFWWKSYLVKKNNNSIFDLWFVSSLFMIIWGRISYIIVNWPSFRDFFWFWIPYERYGDNIYFFRAMPWRLVSFWDGGFLFIPMIVAFLIVSFLFVIIYKKWRWREMMIPIVVSANVMLGGTFFLYGLRLQNALLVRYGFYILLFSILFEIVKLVLKYIYKSNLDAYDKIRQVLNILFMIANATLLSNIFFASDLSLVDQLHVYAYLLINLVMVLAYMFDFRKAPPPESQTSAKQRDIVVNQAIKVNRIKG